MTGLIFPRINGPNKSCIVLVSNHKCYQMLFKVGGYLLPFKIVTVPWRWWAKLCGPQSSSEWPSSYFAPALPTLKVLNVTNRGYVCMVNYILCVDWKRITKVKLGFISDSVVWRPGFVHLKSLERGKITEHAFPLSLSKREIIPFQKLTGEWVQAFGATIFGIVWMDQRYLWLVNGCLGYHRPIKKLTIVHPKDPRNCWTESLCPFS